MRSRNLKDADEAAAFAEALEELYETSTPPNPAALFRVFTDKAVIMPPLVALDAFIDSYPPFDVVTGLVDATDSIYNLARDWGRIFYIGALASKDSFEHLRTVYPQLNSGVRQQIDEILEDIYTMNITNDTEMEDDLKRKITILRSSV